MDGGEGSSHAETDSCATNHHEQIDAQSEQPPQEVVEEITVVENPAIAEEIAVAEEITIGEEVAVAEEIALAEEIVPPSIDNAIAIAIAIAIPPLEKHSSVGNEEDTDANGKVVETKNDEQITDAGYKSIEMINDEKITEASSISEHGEATSSTTTLGKRKPESDLNADAQPWSRARIWSRFRTPEDLEQREDLEQSYDSGQSDDSEQSEDLEQSRASLSQSWKLGFPSSKKLLVLDVNGLLVARYSKLDKRIIPRGTPHHVVAKSFMFKRPFCDSFLEFCFDNFFVGVWSSMMEGNVHSALDYICKETQHKFLFVWHQGDCTNTGLRNPEKKGSPLFLKELDKIWGNYEPRLFDKTNTLLIDDTPYKALWNPPYTAIFPQAYWYNEADDFLKTTLTEYLTQLRDAADVQEFVRSHPIGEPAIAPGCLYWDNYYEEVVKMKWEKVALSALPTTPATPPPPETQMFSPELLPQTQISSPESVFSQEVEESFSCAETAEAMPLRVVRKIDEVFETPFLGDV